MGSVLNRLAAAFIMRERDKAGITTSEQAATAAGENSLVKRAQLAQIAQNMKLQPAMQQAQIGQMNAHANAYNAPKPASVGDAIPVMGDDGNVLGFIGKRPGPDGNLPHFDNQGRQVGGVHPDVLKSAVPAGQQGAQPTATADDPNAPIGDYARSVGMVEGQPEAPAQFPTTYRTKPKPAPKAPAKAHLVAGTDLKSGNPRFGVAGEEGFGPPMTTVERTRRDQASHVISQGAALIAELNKPEVQAIMGPRQGLVTGFKDTAIGGALTGGAPPEAAHLASSISSMSAFLPIMHGMRGGDNMIQHFERQMGKSGELAIRRNPAAVQAAILALVEAAKRIREQGDNADLTGIVPEAGEQPNPMVSPSPAPSGFRYLGEVK